MPVWSWVVPDVDERTNSSCSCTSHRSCNVNSLLSLSHKISTEDVVDMESIVMIRLLGGTKVQEGCFSSVVSFHSWVSLLALFISSMREVEASSGGSYMNSLSNMVGCDSHVEHE